MTKKLFTLAITIFAILSVGCAVTDYDGIPGHKTTGDAKLAGLEVSFDGFGPDVDGTYAYTVKYDNTGGNGAVTINSLRNEVQSSFTRDGEINQDGGDVQGGGGVLGGKFLPQFVSVDNGPGCQFGDNLTQDKSDFGPGIFSCNEGSAEENDRDAELHASFSSLDDIIGQIFSGALTGQFSLELTGLTINGTTYPVPPVSIGARAASNRPARFEISNQPSLQPLVQTILDNTNHMEGVNLGLEFEGGLSFSLSPRWTFAFNHNVLSAI